MDYLKLNRAQKAAILYLMAFQLSEMGYDNADESYYPQIHEELQKLGFPHTDQVVYDEDGQPMISWETFLSGPKSQFDWYDFIEEIDSLTKDEEARGYDVTYIGNLPFEFQYPKE